MNDTHWLAFMRLHIRLWLRSRNGEIMRRDAWNEMGFSYSIPRSLHGSQKYNRELVPTSCNALYNASFAVLVSQIAYLHASAM